MPKRYTASVARERLADLLDAAEAGEPVVIERRGVRYTLAKAGATQPARVRRALVVAADPAVVDGQWSWAWDEGGLSFAGSNTR